MNSSSPCNGSIAGRLNLIAFNTLIALIAIFASVSANAAGTCAAPARNITADVVAFDIPLMWNRLGAQNINGMMYALERNVVVQSSFTNPNDSSETISSYTPISEISDLRDLDAGKAAKMGKKLAGNVTLRPDKRPRPLVLRMGKGDCMTIKLTNLLTPDPNPFQAVKERNLIDFKLDLNDQVEGRKVSLRFQGTELVDDISDDGSFVGQNASSLVDVGASDTFRIRGLEDGAFVGTSFGQNTGGEGLGGQTASGLFAVLNVNAEGAGFFRSLVTNEELLLAADWDDNGVLNPFDSYLLPCSTLNPANCNEQTEQGHPIVNWQARYPNAQPWIDEGKAGLPVLNMIDVNQGNAIVHSDIDAIVAFVDTTFATLSTAGEYDYLGHFPRSIYPLESAGKRNPSVPNRLEPFREYTVAFHDEVSTKQAFPKWFEDPILSHTLHGVRDSFMINYGSGGIGSEIIANRLGVGPMHDCVNCVYEEFFLTFSAVGEVGQLTDIPANMGLELCDPALNNCENVGPKANYILFPDDPSNVHHSYIGDAIAFRNLHAGPGEQHVFHLHNHQWLFNADDDNSNYLDAQGLGPGSGYAYWVNFGGSGNRNKTAGDAIFHCHFYPHFAQGMWEMWRIHDTFEPGTELVAQQFTVDDNMDNTADRRASFVEDGLGTGNGTPMAGARALPDAEVIVGAPTPAVVPLPGKPMAPYPGKVTVKLNPNMIGICPDANGLPTRPDAVTDMCAGNTVPLMRNVGSLTDVQDRTKNPGYPFWIAGMEHTIGNRPPTPPLDMLSAGEAKALHNPDPLSLWRHPGFAAVADGDVNIIDGWDGGLPRFSVEGYSAGGNTAMAVTRLDFTKEIEKARPVFFPEEGTDLEQIAMAYHAKRCHETFNPDGSVASCALTPGGFPGGFITNGAPPVPGAPFQEPCIDDRGELLDGMAPDGGGHFFGGALEEMWDRGAMSVRGSSPHNAVRPRYYKAANVQFDATFNKLGYHFPQQRIITMWQDVIPTINKERPPEPFVLRMNTFDCAQYVHSNVVPKVYELDDYQVRTPTDIIGQHIHLPKWDLVSADGSANGWNYEDGTLSPGAVVEMIEAINHYNLTSLDPVLTDYDGKPVVDSAGHTLADTGTLEPSEHPYFGDTIYGACADDPGTPEVETAGPWCGARSTMQRWFADPVVNVQGVDRGLGIIFTHDHYGPSTHQQVGLYATMLIEPAGSKWVHNETGRELNLNTTGASPNGRIDGGPTSWQASILTGADGYGSAYDNNVKSDLVESYREFYIEYTDFQHAYQPGKYVGAGPEGIALVEYDATDEMCNNTPFGCPNGDYGPDGFIDNPIVAGDAESFRDAIQPPIRLQASDVDGYPLDIWEFPEYCPGTTFNADGTVDVVVPRPCAEAITADDPGLYVVNYRNESLAARIYDPDRSDCPDPSGGGCQAAGKQGDLAFAMDSTVTRVIPELNDKLGLAPAGYGNALNAMCDDGAGGSVSCPPITDLAALSARDPFTPTMRGYDGDRIHIKMQAGGQEEEHGGTVYGMKWLQGGSGFGTSKNSGWRNAQNGGISEQFTLTSPIYADYKQRGNTADYAYSFNPSTDGWTTGTWGIMRSYGNNQGNSLQDLPGNSSSKNVKLTNGRDYVGVCPKSTTESPRRYFDITVVQANDVLGVPVDGYGNSLVNIQDQFQGAHVGAAPDPSGGTLVYNDRTTKVNPAAAHDGEPAGTRTSYGPLHDPTAMLYVWTDDLESVYGDPVYKGKKITGGSSPYSSGDGDYDPYCWRAGGKWKYDPSLPACKVKLKDNVPVEPLVLRAAAGDCMDITLRNKLLSQAYDDAGYLLFQADGKPAYEDKRGKGPQYVLSADTTYDGIGDSPPTGYVYFDQTIDLPNGNALAGMVRRKAGMKGEGMTTFNNNLMQPSAWVGMHPQLVEYDITRSDGTAIGQNGGYGLVAPGSQGSYQWYAGSIEHTIDDSSRNRSVTLTHTPIEFGGFNIMPADPIEQGQKGLIAAAVIYPQGATWTVDAGSNTSATVTATGIADEFGNPDINDTIMRDFRDFTIVAQKGASMYYADSYPVENILGEGSHGVAEDAQDMGHMAINYGNEAMWFRAGVNPTDFDGMTNDPDAHELFSNTAAGVGTDPQTAVFTVTAGDPYRMHVLMPFAPGRGSTFDLHGHVFLRDPYVCEGIGDTGGFDSDTGLPLPQVNLPGRCDMGNGVAGANGTGEVGSQRLGTNPQGFALGGIESWFSGQHYEIVIPMAGGQSEVTGDYLFRDHMGLGNAGGLWGILRVEQ